MIRGTGGIGISESGRATGEKWVLAVREVTSVGEVAGIGEGSENTELPIASRMGHFRGSTFVRTCNAESVSPSPPSERTNILWPCSRFVDAQRRRSSYRATTDGKTCD
ncbi:hypothetical protein KM043_004858 [Ampulex compressa]|nr:hypothetical protein KM043_004858 [Ampulex compressa]